MIKHVSFLTKNINAVVDFYSILGAEVEKNITTHENYGRLVLRLGESKLQFFEIPNEQPSPHCHWAEHIAVYVQDLDATMTVLESKKTQVTRRELSPSGNKMAFVLDPDGRQVELLET